MSLSWESTSGGGQAQSFFSTTSPRTPIDNSERRVMADWLCAEILTSNHGMPATVLVTSKSRFLFSPSQLLTRLTNFCPLLAGVRISIALLSLPLSKAIAGLERIAVLKTPPPDASKR